MIITVPATFDSASRKKDKSVRLSFTSNLEISSRDFLAMDMQVQQSGWLAFGADDPSEQLPEEPAPTREGKSKGQRMRAVYFLLWKKLLVDEPFETWYDRQYEMYLDKLKARLD